MSRLSRILIALASLSLLLTYLYPLWRIELTAPQYPEGLVMLIHINGLGGDFDVINGLNHYIGMATMHTEDFIEFKILPYIIAFSVVFGLLTALIGKRGLLFAFVGYMILFGIVAMVDFYMWEYDYGHNLDPTAPIQVPGMSYQPPLIGYKLLLNFGAFSIPDIGGWSFVFCDLLLVTAAFLEWKKMRILKNTTAVSLAGCMLLSITLSSCSVEPQNIILGKDQCQHCKMLIMDNRFGSEIILKTGKAIKFDDLICMDQFVDNGKIELSKVHTFYVVDYITGELFPETVAYFAGNGTIRSPMGGNIAAFKNENQRIEIMNNLGAVKVERNPERMIGGEQDIASRE